MFGHPYFGVLLTLSLLIAAVGFMLHSWVSPGWALLGAFSTALTFGAGHYWTESYMGGSVAAAGGALLLGAYRYLRIRKQARYGVIFGARRPAAYQLATLRRRMADCRRLVFGRTLRVEAREACLHFPGRDFVRTTSPHLHCRHRTHVHVQQSRHRKFRTPPYVLHQAQYAVAPPLWPLEQLPAKTYRNPQLERLY